MDNEIAVNLEDLQLVEIQELLEESGIELDDEQIADLARFVQETGGLAEALDAIEELGRGQEAA